MPQIDLNSKISRRKLLVQIARVATSKLIRGDYQYRNIPEISAEDLSARLASGQPPLIVDVRSVQDFNSGFGHIPDSKLIPMMNLINHFSGTEEFNANVAHLETQLEELVPFAQREIVTICPGGGFSLVAAEIMSDSGFRDVKSLNGGIDGWFKQGYPTTLN